MVPFSFGGHRLDPLPSGALWWPARRALLVADLHLEKGSFFARFGQMLPPYDSLATLADLATLARATAAAEIWCLGDSFHDVGGCDRLPDAARDALTALTAVVRWTWITGNHDPAITDRCGGEVADEAVVDGLVLPAFGALTGGLEPHHPAIRAALGADAEALVPIEDRLLRFPVAA